MFLQQAMAKRQRRNLGSLKSSYSVYHLGLDFPFFNAMNKKRSKVIILLHLGRQNISTRQPATSRQHCSEISSFAERPTTCKRKSCFSKIILFFFLLFYCLSLITNKIGKKATFCLWIRCLYYYCSIFNNCRTAFEF